MGQSVKIVGSLIAISRLYRLRDAEADWPKDLLLIEAIKHYLLFPLEGVSYEYWIRDLALVALGLRMM
ncbi:7409_t:CDS:2, partial [Cetraspora pellucida]